MSLWRDLLGSKPAVPPDPYARFQGEAQAVRDARHKATYAALNRLASLVDVDFGRDPPFSWGMATEDYIQSVGDIARAAVKALEQRAS